jgi:Transposase DDE domain
VFFLISQSKRSLSIELNEYFDKLGQSPCTKGALSKARYRVLWLFFRDWHRHFIDLVYADPGALAKWKGYFLKAVDGTSIYLFKDAAVEKEFGSQSNQHMRIPMARAGIELDVLNGYCTQAQLQPYSEGEIVFAEAFLENSSQKDLRIYDRYFASFELIYKHLQKKAHFLMRCKVDFNQVVKNFVASGKKQSVVEFPIPKNLPSALQRQGYSVDRTTTVRVRLVRVEIDQTEPEILITSLLDLRKYPHSCFKELYNYRWGDETKFDQIKNKLQIEVFSGHKPQAIYQDFFATIIASNLHNLICKECAQELEQLNAHKQTHVAINQNVSIGLLKPRLVNLFTSKNPNNLFNELKVLFLHHLELIRPGRQYPRTKTVRRLKGKYQTFKNYRRAA